MAISFNNLTNWTTTSDEAHRMWASHTFHTFNTRVALDGMVIMTVPHLINSGSIVFMAKGQTWSVSSDNPNYDLLCRLIREGVMDQDRLVSLTSTKQLVIEVGGDRLKVDNGTLILDGKVMPAAWYRVLFDKPELAHVLLIRTGDSVRIEGDEDAPDGTYVVSDLDDADPDQRVYIETDAFFGFPKTNSIKEIINASP